MFGMKKGGGFDNRYKGGKLKNAIYVIVLIIVGIFYGYWIWRFCCYLIGKHSIIDLRIVLFYTQEFLLKIECELDFSACLELY